MTKIITYDGNDNENYTLILNSNEKVLATIDLESTNEIMLGEDETMDLVDDINTFLEPLSTNDDFYITIKNDGDCLGIIIDVWLNSEPDAEPIASLTLWFDDYIEDEDYVEDYNDWDGDDNYGIFIVDPDEWVDDDEWGYDNVRNLAIDSYRAGTKEELLRYLIEGLNNETISDMHWFFLVNLREETIIQYPSSL